MCRTLAVSAAGSDAWRSRPESTPSVNTLTLLSASRVIHQESREPYGSPNIWEALIKQGQCGGAHRVIRLMRIDGIRAKTVTPWRASTQSNHCWRIQPECGRGPHRRVDHRGLSLPGRHPRSVLAPPDRLGDGAPADRGAGRAGPHHGAGEPESTGRAPAPLGSRQSGRIQVVVATS